MKNNDSLAIFLLSRVGDSVVLHRKTAQQPEKVFSGLITECNAKKLSSRFPIDSVYDVLRTGSKSWIAYSEERLSEVMEVELFEQCSLFGEGEGSALGR